MDSQHDHPLRYDCRAGAPPSRGRIHPEPPSPTRTDYQRDRDRIIHCAAFRRLALKTQVFLPDDGDGYRTRLTHTIEVAQIARSIARALCLDEDLTEALALAHDLGHPPFGHTGEDALGAALASIGGFDHNAQTLRLVTVLERRYPDFDGLNLTFETLAGLVKRNGPLRDEGGRNRYGRPIPAVFDEVAERIGTDLWSWPGAEAQAAAIADDVAYNAHDLEDGLDAGLFTLADLRGVPALVGLLDDIAHRTPGLGEDLTRRALARATIGRFVDGVIGASAAAANARERPTLGDRGPVVVQTARDRADSEAIKAFLRERMYRHPRLLAVRARAFDIVSDLATRFLASPDDLPEPWRARCLAEHDPARQMRIAADCLAALTDRGAVKEHRRLFPTTPDLR